MPSKPSELPVVVQRAYEFNLWMIRKVEGFPRSYRFSVGDRLIHGVLDLLLRLVDAAYSRDKTRILSEVNAMLNRMKSVWAGCGTGWCRSKTCTKPLAVRLWANGSGISLPYGRGSASGLQLLAEPRP